MTGSKPDIKPDVATMRAEFAKVGVDVQDLSDHVVAITWYQSQALARNLAAAYARLLPITDAELSDAEKIITNSIDRNISAFKRKHRKR